MLTADEKKRAGKLVSRKRETGDYWSRRGSEGARHWYEAADNVVAFIRRFPHLALATRGEWPIFNGSHGHRDEFAFPCLDHTYFWRRTGVRGPVVMTTFPYHVDPSAMQAHADRYEFTVEIEPPDVPDLWYPGTTIPVVWSRRGVDWRAKT